MHKTRKREYRYIKATCPKPWQVPRADDDFLSAYAMSCIGISRSKIGERFGVSKQRASVMVAKGKRIHQ